MELSEFKQGTFVHVSAPSESQDDYWDTRYIGVAIVRSYQDTYKPILCIDTPSSGVRRVEDATLLEIISLEEVVVALFQEVGQLNSRLEDASISL